ncbi:Glycosyltransferase [Paramagnetospirillum magnetotacticum MS-1]|uniref:Glycosyltransferase n=1 Tax=Paramagnetospirillum magnetotacticum MS-1 TaxID=272627 RepID=A0A0C2YWS2_PARME|nr:glycosyltransferase [Paramagnetospirillum magnetotacticum]KIL99573.1 Glycosyltransferase [Paramagnetospirillum magnetotacticum MS-1]
MSLPLLAAFRSRLAALKYHVTAPKASQLTPDWPMGPPIVGGFLTTPSGIGESARLCLAAFRRLGLFPGEIDLSPRFLPHDRMAPSANAAFGGTGPLVLHVNPPELPAVCAHLGPNILGGRPIIGYWAWELPDIPDDWHRGFAYVHEIWVPSRFTAAAVGRHTDKPVRVVPHPVPSVAAAPHRARFGFPEAACVVMAACDLRSSMARKNPLGALAAFRAAFDDDPSRLLVLKVGGLTGNEAAFETIRRAVDGLGNVLLLTEVLSPEEMDSLIASIDILLSLHRSEGFGLLLAQAMRAGKAVVATDWSGSTDFVTADTAEPVPAHLVTVEDPQRRYGGRNQIWADPDLDESARLLRRLADDPERRIEIGTRARRKIAHWCDDLNYSASLGEPFRRATQRPISAVTNLPSSATR